MTLDIAADERVHGPSHRAARDCDATRALGRLPFNFRREQRRGIGRGREDVERPVELQRALDDPVERRRHRDGHPHARLLDERAEERPGHDDALGAGRGAVSDQAVNPRCQLRLVRGVLTPVEIERSVEQMRDVGGRPPAVEGGLCRRDCLHQRVDRANPIPPWLVHEGPWSARLTRAARRPTSHRCPVESSYP